MEAPSPDRDSATEPLFRHVYDELRRLAARLLAAERAHHTLQPTALVHEVFLRLTGHADVMRMEPAERARFFAAATRAMRQVLVDSARRKHAEKRGGGRQRLDLDVDSLVLPERAADLLALDDALTKLAEAEPQLAQLVSLRFFGGLSRPEIAAVLDVTPRRVDGDWAYARAWLRAELAAADSGIVCKTDGSIAPSDSDPDAR